MTLANEADKMERFIHEIIHEIADDKKVLEYCVNIDDEDSRNGLRDLVALIIEKWKEYEEEYLTKT